MTTHATHQPSYDDAPRAAGGEVRIRHLGTAAPLDWLKAGWQTLIGAPAASLLFGTLFALACTCVLLLTRALPWFTIAFLTGLLLIGPFLASGLYIAARQHAEGRRVDIGDSLRLLWHRRTNLSLFTLFLALIMAAWVRLSALMFAVQVNTFSPPAESYLGALSGEFDPVVTGFFVLIGAILAAVVFVTSAVAIPMIVDKDAGPLTAIQTSVKTVAANWQAMALWAALIVALTGIGILSWFVGMVVLFPLLGYATWHSYRALIE